MMLKLTVLAVVSALVSLTSAQGVSGGVPSCAQPCVSLFTSNGGSEIAGCNRIDVACICANKDFLSDIACCLVDKCNTEDQQKATDYALALCKANQVTGLPTAVSCVSTATATATSGLPTSTNSAAATITSNGSSTTSSASIGANAASTTSSGTTSTPTNAAPTNVAGIGAGIMGGLAAVVALL